MCFLSGFNLDQKFHTYFFPWTALQREIDALKREEAATVAEIKKYSSRGDMDMAKTLAKSVVRNRD